MSQRAMIAALGLTASLLLAPAAAQAAESQNGWSTQDIESMVAGCIQAATDRTLQAYKASEGITDELPSDTQQQLVAVIEPEIRPICDCVVDETSAQMMPGEFDESKAAAMATELTAEGGKCFR